MLHPEDTFPEQEWMTDEAMSSTRRTRDQGARSDQRLGILPRQPSSYSKDDQVATTRPPIGRRVGRKLTRFFITVLIGVGATLAWQSYGDAARETMAAQSPLLAWLSPASQTQAQTQLPVAAAVSPDQAQQLAPLASNLETIRRSVERLAAKQDQMAQTIVLLQATEEDIREKMAFASSAQQTAGNPPPKPPQARAQPAPPRALTPAGAVPR